MRNTINILLCFLLSYSIGNTQSIKRNVISSYGSSSSTQNIILESTFGQPSNIGTVSDGSNYIRQGFQQPLSQLSTPCSISVLDTQNITCYGGNDGYIQVQGTGGSGLFHYSLQIYNSTFGFWYQIAQSPLTGFTYAPVTFPTLYADCYKIIMTDNLFCVDTVDVCLSQPAEIITNNIVSSCDSYDWDGVTYSSSGIYTNLYTNADGCDSTVNLDLTITTCPGCTDSLANNYNPFATVDDSTCLYSPFIFGCTDSTALNYDPLATVDDSSCCYNTGQLWSQIGQDIDGEAAGDYSGYTVSLSSDGNTVAIGAPGNDGNGSDAGHVRIYVNVGSSWTQIGQDIDGEAADDYSGSSVSLSSDGNTVAIGAYHNSGYGTLAGHVRIYENIGGTWIQLGQDIDGEFINDNFGCSVSLSSDGSIVAIGALYNDGNGFNSGHVRVYENISGSWSQIGQDIDGESSNDWSGHSVSLSSDGSIVAIGANGNDQNGSSSGHVRVYENISGSWSQIGQDIDGASGDHNGASVSLSSNGNIVAIGANCPNQNGPNAYAGYVRIYNYNGNTWNQLGSDIDGESAGDYFGNSVSISSDGYKVAIGAFHNSDNGFDSGHVRIYNYNGFSWSQIGSDIDGESAGDYSGRCISLSSFGDKVVIGGQENNGNGTSSGHVRVFEMSNPCSDLGCLDPLALNFDPYATVDDSSCVYPNYGCIDSLALNYDPLSNIDDGSCNYCSNDTSYTNITACDSVEWNGTWYNTSGTYDTTFSTSSGYSISASAMEGNNWTFGWSAGIDFNSGTPASAICSLSTEEGCSSISDTAGDLLFYTDGSTVWDKNHTAMLNGYGLTGHYSSTQSAIIIKKPGSLTNYYIFTLDGIGSGFSISWDGLYFSEVDMTLNGGLGDIVSTNKNTFVVSHTAEKIAVIKHQNGLDFWVVVRLEDFNIQNSNTYHAYLFSSSGLNITPIISNVGPYYYHTLGYLKASPDGKKIAAANSRFTGVNSNNVTSDVNLFDFDNNSGVLSNPMTFNFPFNGNNGNVPYGVEFSPNSNLLYVSSSASPVKLSQFNLLGGSQALIDSSRLTISVSSTGGGALQIGPDGKIYHALWNETNLGVINNPNIIGSGCNYNPSAVSVSNGTMSQGGLPAFYNSMFVQPQISCDSTAILNLTITNSSDTVITISACNGYDWDGTSYDSSGVYTNLYTGVSGCDSSVTLNLTINISSSSRVEITSCDSYDWDGVTYSLTGLFTNIYSDINGCDSSVTLDLTINNSSSNTLVITSCDSYDWDGVTYSSTGLYTNIYAGINGCDSTVTLDLTINNSTTSSLTISACDSYDWNGVTYTSTALYTDLFSGSNGCDSTATLFLTIINSSTSTFSDSTCDVYVWEGITYDSTGLYTNIYTDLNGCDSTVSLDLYVIGCYGCMDPLACNYDSTVTIDDGSCLTIYGCTDSLAFNYDSLATCDDGSCVPFIYGCTDPNAFNYFPGANVDNGTCIYVGCTDSLACNFDTLATFDDGSCLIDYGCIDPLALNYDSLATCSNDSCIFPLYGCTDPNAFNYYIGANIDDGSCLYIGCTDSLACNYDTLANIDDGSCSYNFGCTDSLALNYDSTATCDDGSCQYIINCTSPKPTGLYAFDVVDTRAKVGWDNMNDINCMVWKYFVRYREVGTNSWTTKSAGVGNGLCNFGLNTVTKQLLNLTPSTTYEFKMKAFYCGGTSSNYSDPVQFTTADVCPDMTNLSVQTFNNNTSKAKFTWDTTGTYVFARVLLRVDTTGASWQTAGGFGIYYPTLFVNKFGLQSGESYRAQGRTFCDSNITAYRSPTWTTPIFWTQPGTIRFDGGVSINNLEVYPNPSRDVFNISFNSETLEDLTIRILNIAGAEIYKETKDQFIGEYTKQISLDNYSKGIYFLEIETNDGVVNKKLILQ